jgi:hypothetical protein
MSVGRTLAWAPGTVALPVIEDALLRAVFGWYP